MTDSNAEVPSLKDASAQEVQALVDEFMPINGEKVLVAQATLYKRQLPKIELNLPKSIPFDQLGQLSEAIRAFTDRVHALHRKALREPDRRD